MAPWAALVFGASGVAVGVFLFLRGFALLQRKRWNADTPVSRISSSALGRVKIFGRAAGPYTVISPLAGVDCLYYHAEAVGGEREEGGTQRAQETIFTPLFVQDETGSLLIDPRGAQLEIPREYEESIESESMSECARRFLRRHGLSDLSEAVVSECAIKPGDPLLVLGTLSENSDGDTRARFECGYLSREAADLQRREQMEDMGIPSREMPAANFDSATEFKLRPDVIVSAGSDRDPFILARQNPQRIVDDLARSSFFGIWGGAALALFSLGLMLKWLGLW